MMDESSYHAAIQELAVTLYPTEERNGAVGGVLVDADLLREVLSRKAGVSILRWAKLEKAIDDAYGRWQRAKHEGSGAIQAMEQGQYDGLLKAREILR